MTHVATGSVVRQLGALFSGGSAAGATDRQLLERYNAGSGGADAGREAAFAALVARHGPLVMSVCRGLLGDVQHAEDAFQATFLVLAQKARSIRDPDLLGNWLYGVAVRTARCARQQIARRRRREEGDPMQRGGLGIGIGIGFGIGLDAGPSAAAGPLAPPADRPAIDREQAEALHREVDRLPRAFRLAVVLCYFEGLTLDEAARRLRCPAGTVGSRLARAKEKLRAGLVRRGVMLPAAALAATLAPRSAQASLSPLLCDATTRAAIAFAARHSAAGGVLTAPASALAQEVLRTMLIHKFKVAAMSLLVLAAVATGAGWLARSMAMNDDPSRPPAAPVAKVAPRGGVLTGSATRPDPLATARMTVTGRVLGTDGKPIPGALIDVVARPRVPLTGASEDIDPHTILGQGRSDVNGGFRLDAARTASARVYDLFAIAHAPGYGLGWSALNPDADQPAAEIRLRPEQPVRVRLVDVTGTPARGAEVRVSTIGPANPDGTTDGLMLGIHPPEGMRTWPRPVRSDDQGKATVRGIGRGLGAWLTVVDSRYALQNLQVAADGPGRDRGTTIALQPARLIEGRVLAADTGQPIPNAVIAIAASENEYRGMFTTRFRADDRGRYSANPSPGDYFRISTFPPPGQPYVVADVEFVWTRGAVKKSLDLPLPRGVVIRGRVTEAGTNRPLPESSIHYIQVGPKFGDRLFSGWQATQASKANGSFELAVPPGKGHLLAFDLTGDHVLRTIGYNKLYEDRPGGPRYYAHAIIPYEARAGDPPRDVAVALKPGMTIKGRVEGPDGQTIGDAVIVPLRVDTYGLSQRLGPEYQVNVHDGRFELHGLDPDGRARISLFEPDHGWGATVEVSGKQAGEDMTIRLGPCGQARARFVGPDGKTVAGLQPGFEVITAPGPSRMSPDAKDRAELAADAVPVAYVDPSHYASIPRTEADGRITLGWLIPGAMYRIFDYSTKDDDQKGIQVRKDFTVKPGETLDLGDILVEKPQSQ